MSKSKVFCFLSCVLLLVVLVLPSSASSSPDDSLILSYPVDIDYSVLPLTLPTSYYVFYGTTINTTSYVPLSSLNVMSQAISYSSQSFEYRTFISATGGSYVSTFMGVGIPGQFKAGSSVTLNWSNFRSFVYSTKVSSPSSGFSYSSNTVQNSQIYPSYYVYDQYFNILAGPFSGTGQTTLTLSSNVSTLIFGYYYTCAGGTGSSAYVSATTYLTNAPSTLTYSVYIPPTIEDLVSTSNSLVSSGNATRSHIDSDMHQVITILQDMSTSAANDPMSQFEGKYLEQMGDQLTGVEGMMSSSNPALPNGGDFVGFADDMQKGFGVNGSSFNPSDFSSAAGSFSGSSSTAEGGPWEFFSQSVADSLAGGASSIGLDDDDYIYAWLEQSERRYGLWASFNP